MDWDEQVGRYRSSLRRQCPYRVYEVLWCPGLRLSTRKLINVGFSVVEGNHPFNMIMHSGTREQFSENFKGGCVLGGSQQRL